jgi:hypothetical protein
MFPSGFKFFIVLYYNFSFVAVSLNKTEFIDIFLGANADYSVINNNGFNALKLGILFEFLLIFNIFIRLKQLMVNFPALKPDLKRVVLAGLFIKIDVIFIIQFK